MPQPLIVLINHNSGLNGSELSFFDVVRGVDRSKFAIHVLLPSPGPLVDKVKELGIPVTILPQHSWRWYYPGIIGRLKFLVTWPLIGRAVRQYKLFLRQNKASLVYLNINRLFVPLLAAHACGIPTVVHFRDIPSKVRHTFVGGQQRYFGILNKATVWVANSHATKEDIQPHTDKDVRIVYNAVDFRVFARSSTRPPAWKRPTNTKVIAMIGTLTPWKNQKDFILMAARLSEHRDDLIFWVVGAGAERKQLEAQVSSLNLVPKVVFTGFVDDIAPLYSQIDLLVHTMPGESFGRVFVEAMYANVPIVAYRSGAASDLIENGVTGWLVDDFDVKGLARQVTEVLANPALVKMVTDRAHEKAVASFSTERLANEMNLIFAETIKQS